MLKIGEVARRTGIGIETLRFYERSGLLKPPARTMSGYRVYDDEAIERLDFIKRAQTLGFTLDEIRQIINESAGGVSPCADVRSIMKRRLKELDERMAVMKRYRDELAEMLIEWEKQGDVPGHICGLIENARIEAAPIAGNLMRRGRKR
ncbi:MAG: heavy metal-responsive transcriptional regulator [Blastocatellales bacterium]